MFAGGHGAYDPQPAVFRKETRETQLSAFTHLASPGWQAPWERQRTGRAAYGSPRRTGRSHISVCSLLSEGGDAAALLQPADAAFHSRSQYGTRS